LNTDGVDDNFAMSEDSTPLRSDEVNSSPTINSDIIANAPKSGDNFFIVPKIIE